MLHNLQGQLPGFRFNFFLQSGRGFNILLFRGSMCHNFGSKNGILLVPRKADAITGFLKLENFS